VYQKSKKRKYYGQLFIQSHLIIWLSSVATNSETFHEQLFSFHHSIFAILPYSAALENVSSCLLYWGSISSNCFFIPWSIFSFNHFMLSRLPLHVLSFHGHTFFPSSRIMFSY